MQILDTTAVCSSWVGRKVVDKGRGALGVGLIRGPVAALGDHIPQRLVSRRGRLRDARADLHAPPPVKRWPQPPMMTPERE